MAFNRAPTSCGYIDDRVSADPDACTTPAIAVRLMRLALPAMVLACGSGNAGAVELTLQKTLTTRALERRSIEPGLQLAQAVQPAAEPAPAPSSAPPAASAPSTPPASPAVPTPPAAPAPPAASSSAPGAVGTFEVDEDAAQRALERTLTQAGALLLQPGTVEFSPGMQFVRSELSVPTLLTVVTAEVGTPQTVVGETRLRRSEFFLRADFRIGLPMNAQAEFSLPFTRITARQDSFLQPSRSDNANGIGDIVVGVAKTIAREEGARPDLIGRVSYNFGNGKQFAEPLSTGAGFRQLQLEAVAVKRQDPLAFVGSISYSRVFEKDGIKPGDATVVSLSTLLAASPATSLQLGFSQVLRAKQEVGGVKTDSSDQTYGIFTLGASSIISRDATLVTQFGIGAGNDAPKYTFGVSLPILFR